MGIISLSPTHRLHALYYNARIIYIMILVRSSLALVHEDVYEGRYDCNRNVWAEGDSPECYAQIFGTEPQPSKGMTDS